MTANQARDGEIARRIARELLDDHERIASQMVEAIDRGVSAYADTGDRRQVLADVRSHCCAHIRSFLSSLQQDPTPPAQLDLSFVEQAIMRRVRQGIPLEAIQHSFRIGHQVLWTAVIDHASGVPGGRAAAILIVQPSIRYIDTVSTLVAEVYLREQQGALADAHRVRRDLLELLLAGAASAAPAADAAGIELGDGPYHLVVATLEPSGDQYALRALAEEIPVTFAPSAVLVAIRHDTVTALLRGDGAAAVACAWQLVDRHRRGPGPSLHAGIGLPADDLVGLAVAHEQAESALRLTSQATPIVALSQMPALDYLLAGAGHIACSLVPAAVRALALSDKIADRALVQTFGAYLANGLNVRQTAVALPAHPNTVHGRLRRLAQRTGCDLRDVEQLMRLAAELRLGAMELGRRAPAEEHRRPHGPESAP
jgi:PucR-like helix-turn-helix protein/diguanylate cyclase with GGDEF domain